MVVTQRPTNRCGGYPCCRQNIQQSSPRTPHIWSYPYIAPNTNSDMKRDRRDLGSTSQPSFTAQCASIQGMNMSTREGSGFKLEEESLLLHLWITLDIDCLCSSKQMMRILPWSSTYHDQRTCIDSRQKIPRTNLPGSRMYFSFCFLGWKLTPK